MNRSLIKSDIAYKLHEELRTLTVSATYHFFRMGEIMKKFRDRELWVDMGYDSFESYFSDPELDFKRSSVYHAIRLVNLFPDWKGRERLVKTALSKLIMIAPHLNKENEEELLSKAWALSKSDLQHELVVMELTQKGIETHNLPKVYFCKDCGKVKGITFAELCMCGLEAEKVGQVQKMVDKLIFGEL
jgi:hypothetical protein